MALAATVSAYAGEIFIHTAIRGIKYLVQKTATRTTTESIMDYPIL